MPGTMSYAMMRPLNLSRDVQFWLLQTVGWISYSLVTFFALTVWGQHDVTGSPVLHIAVPLLMGILCTWPLRPLYRWALELPLLPRILIASAAIFASSWFWTASRMTLFKWLSGEQDLWQHFNDWYFGSLFVFISWTAIYFGLRYYQLLQLEQDKLLQETASKRDEKLRRLEAEAQSRDAQLRMLRYQLNPHFLFNTLNALNALVRTGETGKAAETIEQLSSFLRHALDEESQPLVTLDEELFMLGLYLDIEMVRFEDRLQVAYSVQPEVRQALVPSMILQPLIENSMKYAVANSEEGGSIRVSAVACDQRLQLEVTDSGPGMDINELGKERGIGLSNTLNRLETLFPGDFVFEALDVEPSGLRVRIDIPMNLDAGVQHNAKFG